MLGSFSHPSFQKKGSTAPPNRHRFQDSMIDFWAPRSPSLPFPSPTYAQLGSQEGPPQVAPQRDFFIPQGSRITSLLRHRFWIVLGSILGVLWTRCWRLLASNLNGSDPLWARLLKNTGDTIYIYTAQISCADVQNHKSMLSVPPTQALAFVIHLLKHLLSPWY